MATPSKNAYYVSTGGNDVNPGTQELPWRTVSKAAAIANAGNTVIVLPGNYPERVELTTSGVAGNPITFQADGAVKMQGFTITASYVTIRGFEVSVSKDDMTEGVGIYLLGSYDIIDGNNIHDCSWGGVVVDTAASTNDIVSDNSIRSVGLAGIQIYGRNNLIENNDISNVIQNYPGVNAPSWADADGMRFFGSGHVFRRNYFHGMAYDGFYNIDAHTDCFQTWEDSDHELGSNTIFEQNICDDPIVGPSSEVQGSAFTIQGTTHFASNITIRNNILNSIGGVYLEHVSGVVIVNNVMVSKLNPGNVHSVGVYLYMNSNNVIVKNNIFYNVGQGNSHTDYIDTDSASEKTLDAGYNLVYLSDGSSAIGSPRPHDLWNVNPLFMDSANGDYSIQQSSPAINAGYNLPGIVSNDFLGNPRPAGAGYDIGAYEVA
jgi:hypothetical protein